MRAMRGLRGAQVPVHSCSGDPESLGDLRGAFSVGSASESSSESVGAHNGWPAAGAALLACGGQSSERAFLQHVSLKLGEGSHHGEEELAFPRWGVGCLLYTSPSPRDGLLSRMPSSA